MIPLNESKNGLNLGILYPNKKDADICLTHSVYFVELVLTHMTYLRELSWLANIQLKFKTIKGALESNVRQLLGSMWYFTTIHS